MNMDSSLSRVSQASSLFQNTSFDVEGNESFSLIIYPTGPVIPSIVIVLLLSVSSLIAVLGNTLVIVAFIVDKRLRTHNCYFLLNLAICDFFVGSISIPCFVTYAYTGRWSFGRIFCKIWLVVDATLCVSSVYSIVLISYDRFSSVTDAVSYRALQGSNKLASKAAFQLCASWMLSFLITPPAIIFWDIIAGHSTVPDGTCFYEFAIFWHYSIINEVLCFYIPFTAVAYLNVTIYWSIRQRNKNKLTTQKVLPNITLPAVSAIQEKTGVSNTHMGPNKCSKKISGDGKKKKKVPVITTTQGTHTASTQEKSSIHMNQTFQSKLRKDTKIAKSLAVIVGVFCICWGPYELMFTIQAICQGTCVPTYVSDLLLAFLWMNSAINPFLYPLCHKTFRRAFKKVLLTMQFESSTMKS